MTTNETSKTSSHAARYAGVSPTLQGYIETHVFPEYDLNDPGHQLDHIHYTIRRSLDFVSALSASSTSEVLDRNIAYTIAAYHDIAHHLDREHHAQLSASRFRADTGVRYFFTPTEITVIAEAIEDHRSSNSAEPRSIYGKIISSADRNTSVEVALFRSYQYRVVHYPELSVAERIEGARQHLLEKFGPGGYAVNKIYFPDPDYAEFLRNMTALASDPEEFDRQCRQTNHLGDLDS